MKYTDNYHLDLYETDDNANLLDGYNHSMQILDGALQQMNALLVTQGNSLKAFDTRLTTLETKCADVESRLTKLEQAK